MACVGNSMRIHRIGPIACLFAGLVVTDGVAQPSSRAAAVQSLARAESILIDALARRDRVAFQKMLTAESVFFFPKMSEGPDAIVASWLPFLLEDGPMLRVTSDGVNLTGPNMGASTGSFAISGQIEEGTPMSPAGTLAVSWRRVGKAWKIAALDVTSNGSERLAAAGGIGSYRFGMSRGQVGKIPDCKPYSNESRTGGIQCPAYVFEGQPVNVTFLFNPGGLYRIQLELLESGSESQARESIGRVLDHLTQKTGGVSIVGRPDVDVTPDVVLGLLRQPVPAGRVTQVELSSHAGPVPEIWLARIGRQQFGYNVTLFADRR
jgi:hypothetical protein